MRLRPNPLLAYDGQHVRVSYIDQISVVTVDGFLQCCDNNFEVCVGDLKLLVAIITKVELITE